VDARALWSSPSRRRGALLSCVPLINSLAPVGLHDAGKSPLTRGYAPLQAGVGGD